MFGMRRREFITLLGGAVAAWPLAAGAQQAAMPVIGALISTSPDLNADYLRAFREGLKETGFVEGENVAIVYRWADGQIDRLPGLAAELARRPVAVLIGSGDAPSLAAKAATTTIPIVFHVGRDPAMLGLVASLARPGGNLTGVNFFTGELAAKRLELLRQLAPGAVRVAALLNPANPNRETVARGVESAARAMALQMRVYEASTIGEIDAAFAARRSGSGDVRLTIRVSRVHQDQEAARAGGDHCDPFGGVARLAHRRRFCARLRGERLGRDRRAQEYAHRNHRQAEQGNQRRPRRFQDQGAVRRPGRDGNPGLARRLRETHR
jgi:ABC-type uncharacterized transport system substrate-binding protein